MRNVFIFFITWLNFLPKQIKRRWFMQFIGLFMYFIIFFNIIAMLGLLS